MVSYSTTKVLDVPVYLNGGPYFVPRFDLL